MASAASSENPYAEIERLFLAADRHLSKVDAVVRAQIMVAVADVIMACDPGALRSLDQLLVQLAVPLGPRANVMGTARNATVLARRVRIASGSLARAAG